MSTSRIIKPTSEQLAVIESPVTGSVNVVAGAGTGKTTVLVERYLHLLHEHGMDPDRVLALTFTLKAAAEMRERVGVALREKPIGARAFDGGWVMNFHQFGYRFVREHAPALGVEPDVDVLGPPEYQRVCRVLRRRFHAGRIAGIPEDFGGALPSPRKLDDRFSVFLDAAQKARSDLIPLASLRDMRRDDDHPVYLACVEAVIAIGTAYENELRNRGLLDFSDMIALCVRGLRENDSLRRYYQLRFDHILVDEFQDTSRAQFDLLRILSGGEFASMTVVGDEKQSIYRWRDARVENMWDFPGERFPLQLNRRSYQRILDLAGNFIAAESPFSERADECHLRAHRGDRPDPIVLFHPVDGDEAPSDTEAEALAVWVRSLIDGVRVDGFPAPREPLAPENVAILLRSINATSTRPAIERAFERHLIPYLVVGGSNAAETRGLELLHAWLAILLPDFDVRELLAVLERDPIGLPDAVLHRLYERGPKERRIRDALETTLERIEDVDHRGRLDDVRAIRERLRAAWATRDFGEFIELAVRETQVMLVWTQGGVSSGAMQDMLNELHEIIATLDRRGELRLESFLEHLRVALDERRFREEGDIRFPAGRVPIMTIHQSKGLEFPAVAVPGLRAKRSRAGRFVFSETDGVFFGFSDARDWGRAVKDSPERKNEEAMEAQEERCVLYVAMTRARDYLWVSTAVPNGEKTLFADILSHAADLEHVTVVRDVPVVLPPRGVQSQNAVGLSPEAIAAAINERNRFDALFERRQAESVPRTGRLTGATWRTLSAFSMCPLKVRFAQRSQARDDGGPSGSEYMHRAIEVDDISAVPKGLTASEWGTLLHECFADQLRAPGVPDTTTVVNAARRLQWRDRPGTAVVAGAEALLRSLRQSALGVFGTEARVEVPVYARVGDVLCSGVVDRIERDETGQIVTDYKFGAECDEYHTQVAFYAWMASQVLGEPVRAQVAYIRPDGVRTRESSRVDQVTAMVTALSEAVSSDTFTPTPGDVCADCDWRDVCDFVAPAVTS